MLSLDEFFIVFEGEFEILKNLSLVPKRKVDPKWYFYKRNEDFKSYYHTVVQKFNHINNFNRDMAIKFIGPGQIFGLEDSITRKDEYRYYSYRYFTHFYFTYFTLYYCCFKFKNLKFLLI